MSPCPLWPSLNPERIPLTSLNHWHDVGVRFQRTHKVLLLSIIAVGAVQASQQLAIAASPTYSFVIARTVLSRGASIPRSYEGSPTEAECQWPNGRTSITVAQARDVFCGGTDSIPIVKQGSNALLAPGVDDTKYPPENGSLGADLRFVSAPDAHGVIHVSPVLLEYGDYSGGARPSFISEHKSLWIFDYATEHGAEVIRISTATGVILQRTEMSAISRPMIAVNELGFWMGQASNSLSPSGTKLGIWLAPIGASTGELLAATDWHVDSIVPSGSSVAIYLQQAYSTAIERWMLKPS